MVVRFGKREPDRRGLLDSMDQVNSGRPVDNGKIFSRHKFVSLCFEHMYILACIYFEHDGMLKYKFGDFDSDCLFLL